MMAFSFSLSLIHLSDLDRIRLANFLSARPGPASAEISMNDNDRKFLFSFSSFFGFFFFLNEGPKMKIKCLFTVGSYPSEWTAGIDLQSMTGERNST
jgi:hypothetical protein